jgi:hypothetical protein
VLSVNLHKTELVCSRGRKHPSLFNQIFFWVTLSRSMSVKCLGVVLDSWLTQREHVDVKVRKSHNVLWICRRACGVMWDLRPKVVHWLYVSICRSSITFAPLVWWRGCQTASTKKRLSRIQRLAYVGIMEMMHTNLSGAVDALASLHWIW